MIASVPRPGFVPTDWLRLALIGAAVALPPGVGLAIRMAADAGSSDRASPLVGQVLRGYPITAVLGGTIIFLAVIGLLRQARAMRRGWDDEHIPIIVKPGRYDRPSRTTSSRRSRSPGSRSSRRHGAAIG